MPPIGFPQSGHLDTTTGLPHYRKIQKQDYLFSFFAFSPKLKRSHHLIGFLFLH